MESSSASTSPTPPPVVAPPRVADWVTPPPLPSAIAAVAYSLPTQHQGNSSASSNQRLPHLAHYAVGGVCLFIGIALGLMPTLFPSSPTISQIGASLGIPEASSNPAVSLAAGLESSDFQTSIESLRVQTASLNSRIADPLSSDNESIAQSKPIESDELADSSFNAPVPNLAGTDLQEERIVEPEASHEIEQRDASEATAFAETASPRVNEPVGELFAEGSSPVDSRGGPDSMEDEPDGAVASQPDAVAARANASLFDPPPSNPWKPETIRNLGLDNTLAPPPRCKDGSCDEGMQTNGTALRWAKSPDDAYRMAAAQDKLVFLIHISGNFEIPGFT